MEKKKVILEFIAFPRKILLVFSRRFFEITEIRWSRNGRCMARTGIFSSGQQGFVPGEEQISRCTGVWEVGESALYGE